MKTFYFFLGFAGFISSLVMAMYGMENDSIFVDIAAIVLVVSLCFIGSGSDSVNSDNNENLYER